MNGSAQGDPTRTPDVTEEDDMPEPQPPPLLLLVATLATALAWTLACAASTEPPHPDVDDDGLADNEVSHLLQRRDCAVSELEGVLPAAEEYTWPLLWATPAVLHPLWHAAGLAQTTFPDEGAGLTTLLDLPWETAQGFFAALLLSALGFRFGGPVAAKDCCHGGQPCRGEVAAGAEAAPDPPGFRVALVPLWSAAMQPECRTICEGESFVVGDACGEDGVSWLLPGGGFEIEVNDGVPRIVIDDPESLFALDRGDRVAFLHPGTRPPLEDGDIIGTANGLCLVKVELAPA